MMDNPTKLKNGMIMTQNAKEFFIRDADGDIIGNPKGYRTFAGASRQAATKAIADQILFTFYSKERANGARISSIGNIKFKG